MTGLSLIHIYTDHNHGVVMAGAVDLDVIAVVSKNTDDVVRVKSKGFDGRDEVKLEQLSPVLAEPVSYTHLER